MGWRASGLAACCTLRPPSSSLPLFVSRWRLAVACLSCLFGLFIPLLLLLPQHPWQTFVTRMDAVIKKSLTVTSCLLKRTKSKEETGFRCLRHITAGSVSLLTYLLEKHFPLEVDPIFYCNVKFAFYVFIHVVLPVDGSSYLFSWVAGHLSFILPF